MAATSVRIRWDRRAVRELREHPGVQAEQARIAQMMRTMMQSLAPRLSGEGAASIDVRPDRRLAYALDVGWDALHYYLIFPEFGTKFQPKQRFARAALYDFDYS